MATTFTPGPIPSFKTNEQYRFLQQMPTDVIFLCAYLCFMNPIDFGESAFLRRTDGYDELWVAAWDAELDPGYLERDHGNRASFDDFRCRSVIETDGAARVAGLNLLYHDLRSNIVYSGPSTFIKAGLLCIDDYNLVVQCIKDELNENAARAEESGSFSRIVYTAKKLGLYPRPNGQGPHSWHATCPGTSHPIWINTEKNIFGCPWCKKKGGPDVLKAFVNERRFKGYRV